MMNRQNALEVYLGLGSNEGDRRRNLDSAIAMIAAHDGICLEKVSDIIETEPWGFSAEQKFLNCAVKLTVGGSIAPLELLDICKSVEKSLGREENIEYGADGRRVYHSRPIDVDILLYGDLRISGERLTVPHPQMAMRDFVMVPLRQIASEDVGKLFPELKL